MDLPPLSDSAVNRLPVAIRALGVDEQKVFVLMRMRRDEAAIVRQTGLGFNRVHQIVQTIQNALASAGTLDLIRDPVFFPLDHPRDAGDDEGPRYELPGEEQDPADRIALDRFYRGLAAGLASLPKGERRMLELWFNKEMTAREIIQFYKNIGNDLPFGKAPGDCKESDIFTSLEKIVRNLLAAVRSNLKEEGASLTPSVLKAILNETGV
ncbi:MAG: hypothetical protein HQK87_05565 [Nitrospinae bacterium]|nr:hypothetical protein [Nitrospinota bacterium]